MEVTQVLHMNGGNGDYSYSNNSILQRKAISMTKPIMEEALTHLYYALNLPKTLTMADLGCSSGSNTLFVASEFIRIVDTVTQKVGHQELPEIQIYLNDLPNNDFNAIFDSLSKFHENIRTQIASATSSPVCYFSGVAGSFYTRLFPSNSIHFFHSSYSLMWLSQVPEFVDTNKGNIYMSKSSPTSVITAYREQFHRDFLMFLECRAKEMVSGGRMVLTILGRRSADPRSKECCYVWELLAMALNEMVSEGLIEEGKMDSFDIPQYTPCAKEISNEVGKEGSFMIDRLEVAEMDWDAYPEENIPNPLIGNDQRGYNMAKCMRAVAEPMLLSHFGESIMEEVFLRYKNILTNRMSNEKTTFINVTVSMTRKS